MTPFDLLSLFLALLAVFIAVFIKRPKVVPKIVFKRVVAKNTTTDIEDELNRTRLRVFEKEAKRRMKQRQAAKKRKRVKGRFA